MTSAESKIDAMLQALDDLRRWEAKGWDHTQTVSVAAFRAGSEYGVHVSVAWFCKWLRLHNAFYDRHTRKWHVYIRPRPEWDVDEYTERLANIFEVRKVG